MNITGVIDKINKPNAQPGDYTGEDGLLYCGKCHTPKQTQIAGKKFFCTCKCRQQELASEAEQDKRRKADELREICLPIAAMHNHTFEEADDSRHIQIARRYVAKWEEIKKKNIGLLFWGNTGSGKSFAACCIANALLDQRIPVKYITTVDLISRLMEKEGRDSYLKKLYDAPLLILDDIGAERDTAFSREQLCAVIDRRGESGRPVIVTTNYSLDEMENCSDQSMQRIFNRIKALCVPVAVVGESRRNAIGAEKLCEARKLLEL